MLLGAYILRLEGGVNDLFATIPRVDYRLEGAREKDEASLKEALRFDREKNLHGLGVPDENPSLDPSVVQFFYMPTMARQRLYARGLPVQRETYKIIDAFVCLGSRFGLDQIQVFVELCRSDMGNGGYWANIFYVANSEVPACIMKIQQITLDLNTDAVLAQIERDRRDDASFRARLHLDDEEEVPVVN